MLVVSFNYKSGVELDKVIDEEYKSYLHKYEHLSMDVPNLTISHKGRCLFFDSENVDIVKRIAKENPLVIKGLASFTIDEFRLADSVKQLERFRHSA